MLSNALKSEKLFRIFQGIRFFVMSEFEVEGGASNTTFT